MYQAIMPLVMWCTDRRWPMWQVQRVSPAWRLLPVCILNLLTTTTCPVVRIVLRRSLLLAIQKSSQRSRIRDKGGQFPFTASGKAKAAGAPEGFVKVIFDARYGEFLGAHMIGANVTEMIAEVVTARKLETTGHEILKAVHPHPTMSEALMETTAAAYDEVIHL